MRRSSAQRALKLVATSMALAMTASIAAAQAKPASLFNVGYTDIGPAIGLGGIGSASVSFGGRFENAIKALPDLGNGILGIEAAFDYYSWSNTFASWSYMPIGVTANYHFKLDEPKIDPFIGLGLGYQVISCDVKGTNLGNVCTNSAIYFIGRVGARYFFSPRTAFYADAGAGSGALHVGLMFKLK